MSKRRERESSLIDHEDDLRRKRIKIEISNEENEENKDRKTDKCHSKKTKKKKRKSSEIEIDSDSGREETHKQLKKKKKKKQKQEVEEEIKDQETQEEEVEEEIKEQETQEEEVEEEIKEQETQEEEVEEEIKEQETQEEEVTKKKKKRKDIEKADETTQLINDVRPKKKKKSKKHVSFEQDYITIVTENEREKETQPQESQLGEQAQEIKQETTEEGQEIEQETNVEGQEIQEEVDIDNRELDNHSKRKKKKKKRKRLEEIISEDQPSLETVSSNHSESVKSHHWKKRQKFFAELQDNDSDEEEVEAHRVAMETCGQDMYAQLHETFVVKAADKERLRETAGDWKKGRWSVQEFRLLKRNLKAYMKSCNIDDVKVLIHSTDKSINFYRSIAKDINRPLFIVYRKLIAFFDEDNYVGQWTAEMDQKLLDLYYIHGNKWTEIGKSLGISGGLCQTRHRIIKRHKFNKGSWSREEETRLYDAMKEYCGDQCEECLLPTMATWEMVADRVRTRTCLQCRSMWVMKLSWKLRGLGEAQWTMTDDLKLIDTLTADSELEDEEDVDWEELSKNWPSSRSKYYLRSKWQCLKRMVPNSNCHLFRDCVLYLSRYKAPVMREHLKNDEN